MTIDLTYVLRFEVRKRDYVPSAIVSAAFSGAGYIVLAGVWVTIRIRDAGRDGIRLAHRCAKIIGS